MNTLKTLQLCSLAMLAFALTETAWAQTEEAAVSLVEAARSGPAVASVLDMPHETPAQQLGAVFMLLDLGKADVAAVLWKDFFDEELEDDVKAALVEQFGAARFLKLARLGSGGKTASGLAGGRAFAESCLQASAAFRRAPERLAKLIAGLSDESVEVQRAARSDLAVTGDAGAVACLEALAQAFDPQVRTQLLLTLAKMRPGVEPMLVAAMADGRGHFRRDVVELSGYLHMQDAVPLLAAIAAGADNDPTVVSAAGAALSKMGYSSPNLNAARAVVLEEIRRLESHKHPPTADAPWWSFQAEQNRLTAREVSDEQNHLLTIARLASTLGQLPSATTADRRLALIYAYQISQLLQQPLPGHFQQQADMLSTAELAEMLHQALQGNQVTAAIACAKLLGNRAEATAVQSIGSQRSSLAAALTHPNRDVRYAALEAIMKVKPQQVVCRGEQGEPDALALCHFGPRGKTARAHGPSSGRARLAGRAA